MNRTAQKLIDGRQLMLLLFLGRMFSMMTYSPGKEAVPGSVTLGAQLPALALQLLLLLPAFWLMRRFGSDDLLRCAYCKGRVVGHFCTLLCLAACILPAAQTLTVQADFLTGTIYKLPSRIGLLLALWGGVLYAVHLGLEAVARLSMGIFAAFVVLVFAMAVQALPNIDWLNLHSPLEQGWQTLVQGAGLAVCRSGELAAALLLVPAVRGQAKRWATRACLLWSGFTVLVSFLVLTVLGNFAATRSYPVYTLTLAAGEQAVFGRLDAMLLLVWIFLAVVRGAVYLWLANRCASFLCGRPKPLCAAALLATALLAKPLESLWHPPMLWGGSLFAVTLAVPLTVLLFGQRRKEGENEKAD